MNYLQHSRLKMTKLATSLTMSVMLRCSDRFEYEHRVFSWVKSFHSAQPSVGYTVMATIFNCKLVEYRLFRLSSLWSNNVNHNGWQNLAAFQNKDRRGAGREETLLSDTRWIDWFPRAFSIRHLSWSCMDQCYRCNPVSILIWRHTLEPITVE